VRSAFDKNAALASVAHALFLEEHFGLKPLTTRDGAANDMQDCFDFNQTPLPPRVISRETQLDFSEVNTTMP
jgi:hypothetical protein